MLEIVRDRIERGEYPAGRRLPSERKLAAEFDMPQSRVHAGLRELVASGYLECLRGNGYFVRSGRPRGEALREVAFCWETPGTAAAGRDDFYSSLLFRFAGEYGINLNLFSIPRNAEEQNELFLKLIHDGYEGLFAYPHFISGFLPAFREFKRLGIPLIFWDYTPLPGIFPAVGVDHFHSGFRAAEVLAAYGMPVTWAGFSGGEQNRLKRAGFEEGCRAFSVRMEEPLIAAYEEVFSGGPAGELLEKIVPGKLYFTSTRLLTDSVIGRMFDRGYVPGKDYFLLGTDKPQFLEQSRLQLDCMMRDRAGIVRKLLSEMAGAIRERNLRCDDFRIPMRLVKGGTLPPLR